MERRNGIGGYMGLAEKKQAMVRTAQKKQTLINSNILKKDKISATAGKVLENNSEQIAQTLLDSTLNGNASSAKLLLSLAEKQEECGEEDEALFCNSSAKKLAEEPIWNGETSKAAVKTGR